LYAGQEPLTPLESAVVFDFLQTQFGGLQVGDLSEAVKMAMAETLPALDGLKYKRVLSVGWFGAILSAYKKHKIEQNRRNPPIEPSTVSLQMTNSDEGRDQLFYDELEKMYIKNGNELPETYAWKKARRHAYNSGILKVFEKDETECKELARGYLSKPRIGNIAPLKKVTKNEIDKAMMQLHFDRLYKEL